jgi:ribosome-binding factor A
MSTKRMLQLGEQIRDIIATMFVRGEIRDPRLQNLTILSVKMTSDLQLAKVYFICSQKEKEAIEQVQQALKVASPFIRRELGKQLQIRYTPQVVFYFDDSIEYSLKMSAVLSQVKKELEESEDEK